VYCAVWCQFFSLLFVVVVTDEVWLVMTIFKHQKCSSGGNLQADC
jgi:hypothetical protein